jgi:hypothetical protein
LTLNVQLDWINGSHLYNQTKEWMYRDGIHSDYQQPFTINTPLITEETICYKLKKKRSKDIQSSCNAAQMIELANFGIFFFHRWVFPVNGN